MAADSVADSVECVRAVCATLLQLDGLISAKSKSHLWTIAAFDK